jgi:hypothetical protein
LKQFPTSTFTKETLQDQLKETLKELKTGNSNQKGSEFSLTRDKEIMQQLKETTRHARRNVLKLHADIVNGVPFKNSPVDETASVKVPKKGIIYAHKKEELGEMGARYSADRGGIEGWPRTQGSYAESPIAETEDQEFTTAEKLGWNK